MLFGWFGSVVVLLNIFKVVMLFGMVWKIGGIFSVFVRVVGVRSRYRVVCFW